MIKKVLFAVLFLFPALLSAQNLSNSETSFRGAKILTGGEDVFIETYGPIGSNPLNLDHYAFFEGNSLYLGASDLHGNTIDAIIEFFWFESSIDRGSDFYVAVIKARVTPGDNCRWAPFSWADGVKCHLWTDQWQDWGEHPVLSVEAHTDVTTGHGAFRWDWSIPFESYGIDAYGQVTLKNEYGLGSNAEGAVVAHGEYPLDEGGNIKAEGNIQVKGFANEEFKVKTQYDITLWEWEVFVDGRADLMAWDMYLNLSARDEQSAYHEYFLSIQVEEDQEFQIDTINLLGNFDIGWYDPTHEEVGVSVGPIIINRPYYEVLKPVEEEVPDAAIPVDQFIPDWSTDALTRSPDVSYEPNLILDQGIDTDIATEEVTQVIYIKEDNGCNVSRGGNIKNILFFIFLFLFKRQKDSLMS